MNEFTVRLDLAKGKARQQQTVFVRQGDKNATTIVATITDHGAAASTSGMTARFQMRLPNGTEYYRKAASLSGNTATVTIDEAQAASAVGRTDTAYFQLLQGSTVVASTESFTVIVLPDALADATVPESYDSAIQEAIDNANEAVEQMPDMVEDVLEAHPEWTTTVQDGSITKDKLADGAVTDAKLAQEVKSALDTYCGLNFGESLEIIANEYVDGSGRIASDSHFSRTRAFKVFKNVPLTVKATGYSTGISMIATCTASETNVVPRVRSIDSSEHVYSYTPAEDGYAIVSYNHAYAHEIVFGTDASGAYLKNEVLALSEQMGYPDDTFPLFESAHYIDRNGTKQSSSGFNIYGFVTLDAGDSVEVTAQGYNTAVAVIFAANSNHDVFTPLVMCTDSTARTYTYTATSKMTIGLCSHINTPPTYSVARVPLFERVSDASVENSALNPILAFGAITCIGDSLTWSQVYTGASSSRQAYNPYPKVMEHLTGVPTSYIARPGASPASLWSDSESDVVAKDGQLTIIYLGTNNGLTDTMDTDMAGDDYTTWASTETGCYGKFIAKSLSVNSRVVLVKVHSSSGNVDTTNTVIEKMGQRFGVPVLTNEYLDGDIYHNWPNGQGRNGTHYNDFGYAQFAKNIVGKINNISVANLLNMIPA